MAIGRARRRFANGEYTRDGIRWTEAVVSWRGEGDARIATVAMAICELPLGVIGTGVRMIERAFTLSRGWDTRAEIR